MGEAVPFGSPVGPLFAGVEHVDQRSAGVPDRIQRLLDAAFAAALDDETGAGGDIELEVGIDAPRIACRHLDPRVVETAGERTALDKEIDIEARQQDVVERS